MHPMVGNILRVTTLAICLLAQAATAQEDCSAVLAEYDARLTDKPDDQKKQLALMMRQGIEQSCAFLDAAGLDQFRENLDRIYPPESATAGTAKPRAERTLAEQLAAKQARQEQREKNRLATQQQKLAKLAALPQPSNYAVIDSAPTVSALAGQHVSRAEEMQHLWMHDWDLHNGMLRVVYSTFPDRTQYGLPDWTVNIYVVEITPRGNATQSLIRSEQANDIASLALRRGHDEIFLIRHVDRPGEPTFFERWSIARQTRLTSVDMTGLRPTVNGHTYRSAQFGIATSDGHLMFSAIGGSGRGQSNRVAVLKMSMEGEILGSTELPASEVSLSPSSWFTTNNGGAGLLVDVVPQSDSGIANRAVDLSAFPASVKPVIVSEKLFFLINELGKLAWASTALERRMMFPPTDTSTVAANSSDFASRLSGSTEAMIVAQRNYGSGRNINSLNIDPRKFEMVRPLAKGYAALVSHTANRDLQPPIHGQYLVKLGSSGVTEEHYLNPLALQMEAKFTGFEPALNSDEYYLLASKSGSRAFALHMSARGEPIAYAETSPTRNFDLQRAILVSDESGVWLLGDGYQESARKSLLWIERFPFR